MDPLLERAPTGRAKCRGCGQVIPKDSLRVGECLPNPFADDERPMTVWFHPPCAAYKRPEVFVGAVTEASETVDDVERLGAAAALGVEHPRLQRVDGAERATSGRAKCRQCRAAIPKDAWRIKLAFYDDGMFNAGGFVHAACAAEYFGSTALLDRCAHFAPDLGDDERSELAGVLG